MGGVLGIRRGARSSTTRTHNLPSLLNCLGTAPLTWTTVPAPVDTGFLTARIVCDLEETLTSFFFTNKGNNPNKIRS